MSWADRIAYVCHDFEDAATASVVRADELPDHILERCGASRRTQLAAFIGAMIDTTEDTGRIGMTRDHAEALAGFRSFNYDRIYLRPESRDQAARVITMLRGLVEYLAAGSTRLPARLLTDDSEAGRHRAAVEWVAGMTDRYARQAAHDWLGMSPDVLPVGID